MERQILIVSSDLQFRDALKLVCENQTCQVEAVTSVEDALKIAVQIPICLVIADATVEEIGDGVSLALAFHEYHPQAAFFIIVDEDSLGMVGTVQQKPWVKIVPKPVQMLQFSADVVEAIA